MPMFNLQAPSKARAAEAALRRSEEIDSRIAQDKVDTSTRKDLLLLDLSDSTSKRHRPLDAFKCIIQAEPYTTQGRASFTSHILRTIFYSMRTIVAAFPDYDIVLPSKLDIYRDRVLSLSLPDTPPATIPAELSESIRVLLADSDLRTAFRHILNDKSHPLTRGLPFDSLGRTNSPDYVPTNEDVMMCLHRTSQVEELILESGDRTYRIIDPGGAARMDGRRKWIHQFSRVMAIVFMVSLSDYDCYRDQEDGDAPVSVLLQAFNTFDYIANLKCFKFTNIIIFLTDRDVFAEKLRYSPFYNHIVDYVRRPSEAYDVESACDHILHSLVSRNQWASTRQIYAHYPSTGDGDSDAIKFLGSVIHDFELQIKYGTETYL